MNDRMVRLEANPRRAASLQRNRQRLAKMMREANEGKSNLTALRLAAGLSQTQLAEKMGMEQANISRLERNPGDMKASTMRRLATALGVDIGLVAQVIEATLPKEASA